MLPRLRDVTTNNFRRTIKTGSCTLESAVHFRSVFTRMVDVVTSNDPKYFRRLWIEKMIAACNTIVQSVEEVELVPTLATLKKCCSQLQQYSCLHFPDYLLDMLNDVNTIDAFPNMNDRKLISMLRRLLNQLRYDCIEYSKTWKAGVRNVRSEEKWGQLTIVCEKLTGWIKKIPREEAYLQQTVAIISDFSRQFPGRIPAMLIESLKCTEYNNTNSTPTVNEITTTRISESPTIVDDSSCKKRHRGPNSEDPDLKRSAHNDSLDEVVNRVARNYMNASFKAQDLIVYKCLSFTDTKTSKTLSEMKARATASNAALRDLLKRDGIPSESTLDAFELATQMMTKVIRGISLDAVEYSWLKETIRILRELFAMGSCTALKRVRDSLSESILNLEICLGGTFKFEGDHVPILDTMEQRVERCQNRHDIKCAMGPIQSISSALLIDVERFTERDADRTLVRTHENWSRFAAVGKALSDWMNRALQSNTSNKGLSLNISNKLLTKLLKFDAKWPDRLPPGLLRNTKSLLQRNYKHRGIIQLKGICVGAQLG